MFSLRSVSGEVQRPQDAIIPEQKMMVLSWYTGDIYSREKREDKRLSMMSAGWQLYRLMNTFDTELWFKKKINTI